MLVHRAKRAGNELCICLVPELCYMIGLTDQLKNDFRVMKEIGEQTRLKPNLRQASIDKFIAQFKENQAAVKVGGAT